MKITAFKSEHTGEIFATQNEYDIHLVEYKQKAEVEKKEQELKLKEKELKQMPRLTATSIEDFRQKMFNVVNELNGDNPDKLLGLFFDRLYFGFVSNSHSRPISGVENWRRDKEKPTEYAGWCGEVTMVFSQENNTENIVKNFPAFNSGSGGYMGSEHKRIKGYVLQYGLKLYIDDFPILKEQYENFKLIKTKYDEWKENFYKMVDDKNKSDEIIISYDSVIDDYKTKISTLEKELESIRNSRCEKCNQNKDLVLSENIFTDLLKANEIGKILLLEQSKLLSL